MAATTEMIESKIDKGVASGLTVTEGGMAIKDMGQVMEFSKLMAVSGQAVPPHCRNAVGVCLAITVQALEWRMSPFAVANKSYVVNDRVSYESQLIHAVIEQRAPITARLRHSFSGSGNSRKCKVWATPRGESEPMIYESPEFAAITPKNSPLWKTKPDLQLYYNTSRDWARMYFPDVIMGVYSQDEMQDLIVEHQQPVRSLDELTQRITSTVIDVQPPQEQPEQTALTYAERYAALSTLAEVDAFERDELVKCEDADSRAEVQADCAAKREALKGGA